MARIKSEKATRSTVTRWHFTRSPEEFFAALEEIAALVDAGEMDKVACRAYATHMKMAIDLSRLQLKAEIPNALIGTKPRLHGRKSA